MVGAIGSSTHSGITGPGPSIAGLEAQLARYQKVLSECVSCESAKTHEGQQAIKEVSCKICEIQARIEKATNEKINSQPAVPNARINADSVVNRDEQAASSATATLGSRLNIFA